MANKMMNGATANLSRKFRILVPKVARDWQRREFGQEIAFIQKGHGVLLMPVPQLDPLRGIVKGADPTSYRDREGRL
jgi:hypothetical protein